MAEIKCPHCGQVFKVDESGYASIVSQVRNAEFTEELNKRIEALTEQKNHEIELIKEHEKTKNENSVNDLNNQIKLLNEELNSKDKEIELEKEKSVSELKKENAELKAKVASSEQKEQLAVANAIKKKDDEIFEKEKAILTLTNELNNTIQEKNANEEMAAKRLKDEIENINKTNQLAIQNLEANHSKELQIKDDEIAHYKDLKIKLSTKMVGENLEKHCENEFNTIRAMAFPNAYFEKDNDASGGSKGDYIFKDITDDGVEFISIMFEMKNEMETTEKKHKNEDFFAKLDKDRTEKQCEYAVLVSLLETENELYNTGIVDVSYRYPKMYVIRPQFFIPIISLLRNAALNSIQYKREIIEYRNQNIDISNFENQLISFQTTFGKNYALAGDKFNNAINEIDKAISNLTKVKENLLSSENQLRLANNKAQDLSIKRLTRNNPTMKKMFEDLKK